MHSFADFPDYIIAADIGSLADFTAICTFEQQIWLSAQTQARKQIDMAGEDHWASPADYSGKLAHQLRMIAERERRPPQVPLLLTELTRLPLGTRYPAIIDELAARYDRYEQAGYEVVLVIDAGGPGRPALDELHRRGYRAVGVTLTGGTAPGFRHLLDRTVPKVLLVQSAVAALQSRQVMMPADLSNLDLLIKELMAFKVRVTVSQHETFEGREGQHDDLTISFAIGIWYRNFVMRVCDAVHWQERVEAIKAAKSGGNEW